MALAQASGNAANHAFKVIDAFHNISTYQRVEDATETSAKCLCSYQLALRENSITCDGALLLPRLHFLYGQVSV
jgi:hypothetical protein